jgi:hypothetical protein
MGEFEPRFGEYLKELMAEPTRLVVVEGHFFLTHDVSMWVVAKMSCDRDAPEKEVYKVVSTFSCVCDSG